MQTSPTPSHPHHQSEVSSTVTPTSSLAPSAHISNPLSAVSPMSPRFQASTTALPTPPGDPQHEMKLVTFPLHADYLITQSTLLRSLLAPSPSPRNSSASEASVSQRGPASPAP